MQSVFPERLASLWSACGTGYNTFYTLDVQRTDRYNLFMSGERHKYRDKRTERFAAGEHIREFQSFERQAYRRLEVLEAATDKLALMAFSSNHFEALKGERDGQFSIRINRQWRICFEWPDGESKPFNIEIVDYH